MFIIFNKNLSKSTKYNPQEHLNTPPQPRLPNLDNPSQGQTMDPNIDPALFDQQPQPLPTTQALPSIRNEPEVVPSQPTAIPAESMNPMLTFGPSWLPIPPTHQIPTPSPTISPSPVPSQPIPLLLKQPISITVRWNIPAPVPSAATSKDLYSSCNETLSSSRSELITITHEPTLSSLCFDIAAAFDLDNIPTLYPAPGAPPTKQFVIQVLRLKALKEKEWTTMLITEYNFVEDIVPLLKILGRSGVTVEEAQRIMFLEFGAGAREVAPPKRYVSPYGAAMDVDA